LTQDNYIGTAVARIVIIVLIETAGLFCLASKAFLYFDDLDSDHASAWLLLIGAVLMGGGLIVLLRSESMKQATASQRWRTLFVVLGVSLLLTLITFAALTTVLRTNWPGDKVRPLETVHTTKGRDCCRRIQSAPGAVADLPAFL
jgi:hypothetical protein